MVAAKGQAERYVHALAQAGESAPPFLVIVDVGHSLELHADFTRQGRLYVPFPDPRTHCLRLRDLADESIRDRLRRVWTDPLSLDPSRRSAAITREVAARLATLAQLLEKPRGAPEDAPGYEPQAVAGLLMRCLFTFFAEDVGLLPSNGFTELLKSLTGQEHLFPDMVRSLWETMKSGGFSPVLRKRLLQFNGGLFESVDALPLTPNQLALLIEAGERKWRDVQPAIFGTLLERALDPVERHKLGAHYTPRLRRAAGPAHERRAPVRALGRRPGRRKASGQIDQLIDSLPEPAMGSQRREYCGKSNVRIPKSLHAALAIEAAAEGVSLNQLVAAKLALRLQTR
jgi:hypothetical protein